MSKKRLITAAVIASCAGATAAHAVDVGANTTVGGQVFFDFSNISDQQQAANGTYSDVAPSGTGFDVKRLYLIVDHVFDDIWSADLTTDAQYLNSTTAVTSVTLTCVNAAGATAKPSSAGACPAGYYVQSVGTGTAAVGTGNTGAAATGITTNTKSTEVMVKKLYLQGKFDDALVVRVGSYDTPWISFSDGITGHRYVDKSINDRLGFNTADWGVNAAGSFGGSLLNYSFSALNGGGYKNPSRSKHVDFEGLIDTRPVDWFVAGVGVYSGHLGQVTATNDSFPQNTVTRFNVLAGVVFSGFHLTGEYLNAKNYQTVNSVTASVYGTSAIVAGSLTGTVPHDELSGWSVTASYDFNASWNVFARYDDLDLSKDVAPNLKDKYFNVGVDYKPLKAIDVALVYKNEKVDNGTFAPGTADGNGSYTIGGVAGTPTAAPTDGKFGEVGIYVQWKF